MPSLTKKIVRGKPYYSLRQCQRVNGKPKVVSTIYLGSPESIRERLLRPQPAEVTFQEFGGSAAAFSIAQALDPSYNCKIRVSNTGGRPACVKPTPAS
jgi:hypothetical protein